jgi:ribosomal protein L35
MPKLKTRKSIAKRVVKITSNGKMMRRATSAQHRTTGKSQRTLRQAKMKTALSSGDAKALRKSLPYA